MTVASGFLAALLLSCALTPVVLRLARRAGLNDSPRPNKIHAGPVPTMGGLAVIVTALATAWIASSWSGAIRAQHVAALALATIPITVVGVWDDIRGCRIWPRLVAHAAAGAILYYFDLGVTLVTNPFGASLDLGLWGLIVTIVWVMTLINAMNLVDGLDGLASGIAALAALSLSAVGLLRNEIDTAALGGIVAGALCGFLPYNFPRARIFLGDVGSTFLGLTLATLALVENRKATTALTLLVPLVALALPVVETASSIARRAGRGANPLLGDLGHIHHRLLRLGLSPARATLALHAVTAVFGVMAIVLSLIPKESALLLVLGLGLLAFLGLSALSRASRRC